MIYYDFIVRKEHKFIRNVLNPDVLIQSENFKNLNNYHSTFNFFVNVSFTLHKF